MTSRSDLPLKLAFSALPVLLPTLPDVPVAVDATLIERESIERIKGTRRQHSCLPSLIKAQTSVRPNAIAVLTIGRQLTYLELDRQANCFAGALLQAGVRPGILVGIFMDRSPECLAAMLGIWKVGAAYLAFDPTSPPERLAFVLQDAGVSFIIAEKKLAPFLPAHTPQVLFADDVLSLLSGAEDTQIDVSPNDLAYVLYTSGSTGKPKGVEVCHGGVMNVVTALAEELKLQPAEILLAHTSLGFDVSNLEIYLPLVSGGSVYLAEAARVGDAAKLRAALTDSQATTMLGTCTLWRLLLESGWSGKPDLRAISGGEALPLSLAMALVGRTAEVWNQYGPTEATICATTARIHLTDERITIGHPISNVSIHILDADLQPVPAGATGELYIGGCGVARGYRNRPDLTAASFLPDPFSFETGARLYKTGDLARKLPDGSLDFCGRIDNQVKIHGYRIELDEIESQLREFPEVRAAAVAAIERGPDDRRIVAWFESMHVVPAAQLRDFLRTRLPSYMLPSEFRQVARMPLNESGKIDRTALGAGLSEWQPAGPSEAIPATDLESRLRSVWQDLLHVRPIAVTDSFFDLGGDSLLATLLVMKINTHFGTKLSPDALLEYPDIKSLAVRIMTEEHRAWPAIVPLRARGSKPPLFIVHGLGGSVLLFRSLSAHLSHDQPVYCVTLPSGVVRDKKEMDIKTLAAAFLQEIRLIAPYGPYYLGGHSFGALIAFEMALQLAQGGEPVALLALIDGDRNLAKRTDGAFNELTTPGLVLRRYQAKLRSLTEKGIVEVFRRRVEYVRLRKRVKLAKKAAEGATSTSAFEAKELLVLAGREYNPVSYPGSAILFRAKDEVRSHADRDLGWAELVSKGLQIVDVPGEHLTIFDEPYVETLAKALTARLS